MSVTDFFTIDNGSGVGKLDSVFPAFLQFFEGNFVDNFALFFLRIFNFPEIELFIIFKVVDVEFAMANIIHVLANTFLAVEMDPTVNTAELSYFVLDLLHKSNWIDAF